METNPMHKYWWMIQNSDGSPFIESFITNGPYDLKRWQMSIFIAHREKVRRFNSML